MHLQINLWLFLGSVAINITASILAIAAARKNHRTAQQLKDDALLLRAVKERSVYHDEQ